ncbi:hypothetical protein [Pseudomonas rhodesiae]|uniref:hypothetical protein n=1 Tax=Pseudomonas rhodesiae TaxID=76760 RepID=UPI0028D12344|nr:hypothetical protein [Pseudomonas rhodesiae]
MSEVQSFWCHEASNILCVRASDFDRVTAELQRVLDHKEQQRESELRNGQAGDRLVGELQQRLTAADERVDVLEGFLRKAPRGVPGFAEWEKKSIAALKQAEAPPKKVKPTCHWACTGCDICGSAGRGDTWS